MHCTCFDELHTSIRCKGLEKLIKGLAICLFEPVIACTKISMKILGQTMIVLSVTVLVLLLHIQNINAQCSTPEMRTDLLDEALATLECNNYTCALLKVLSTANNPAKSCAAILVRMPSAPSGYYWLQSANGSAVRVFCDMDFTCKGVGGGWMQVAKLDMTNSSHQCPPGTVLKIYQSKRVCGNTAIGRGCSSTVFNVHGIKYRQVCGKIIAYQFASPDAFGDQYSATRSNSVDGNYVDGISLTHGRNPRNHIWTFVGDLSEVDSTFPWKSFCPCNNVSQIDHWSKETHPPSFVENDYFCDTGSAEHWQHRLYPDDPLWDGAGCGPANTCCSLNNPPWFLKQLPSNTTDDIEVRMCHDEALHNEDTPIETIELYVH